MSRYLGYCLALSIAVVSIGGATIVGCAGGQAPADKFDFAGTAKDFSMPVPDLTGADLTGADLAGADLSGGCPGKDLMNDAANCGRCGRSCGAALCTMGRCPAETLYSNQPFPVGLAGDATQLYWSCVNGGSNGFIFRGPIGGGTRVEVANTVVNAGGLTVGGGKIIWAEQGSGDNMGAVRTMPTSGMTGTPTPTNLGTSEASPTSVITNGTNVYWTNSGTSAGSNGVIRQSPIGGGGATNLGTSTNLLTAGVLFLQGTTVFFTQEGLPANSFNDGKVSKIVSFAGAATDIATAQKHPFGITADASFVYWAEFENGTVYKAPVGGGAGMPIATGQMKPEHVAVDSTGVYWTNRGTADGSGGYTGGQIMYLPLAGGTPVALAINQNDPIKLILDATYVYWVNAGTTAASHQNGEVVRVVK
jgi:hypothetical protein